MQASPWKRWLAHLCATTTLAAPAFAVFEGWEFLLMVSGGFSYMKPGFPWFVYQHPTGFSVGIVTEAAPLPLSWFEDESTLHRVAVDVA